MRNVSSSVNVISICVLKSLELLAELLVHADLVEGELRHLPLVARKGVASVFVEFIGDLVPVSGQHLCVLRAVVDADLLLLGADCRMAGDAV